MLIVIILLILILIIIIIIIILIVHIHSARIHATRCILRRIHHISAPALTPPPALAAAGAAWPDMDKIPEMHVSRPEIR